MRVLIIGGTGRCGKIAIDELLSKGHQVVALARNPSVLGEVRTGLTVIKGKPFVNIPTPRLTYTRNTYGAIRRQGSIPAYTSRRRDCYSECTPGQRQSLRGPYLSTTVTDSLQRQRHNRNEAVRGTQGRRSSSIWGWRIMG